MGTMTEKKSADRRAVDALLSLHGISAGEDEVANLVDAYPGVRAAMESLRAMEGTRYEEPAVIFDPRW